MLAALANALIRTSDEYRAIVARDGRTVVGGSLCSVKSRVRAVRDGSISSRSIGAARRRGIASALVNAACQELSQRQARFVHDRAPGDTHASRALGG